MLVSSGEEDEWPLLVSQAVDFGLDAAMVGLGVAANAAGKRL